MNRTYLNQLRSSSCYPTFRGFVTIATVIGYLVAAGLAVAGVLSGQPGGIVLGFVLGVIVALVAKVAQEISLMVADIADATIDVASRAKQDTGSTLVSAQPLSSSTPMAPAVPVPQDAGRSNAELMAKYGITYDGKHYRYSTMRFGSPLEAIQYAQSVARPSDA